MPKGPSRYVDPQASLDNNNLPLSSYGSVDTKSVPNFSKSYSEAPEKIADTGTATYNGDTYEPNSLDDKNTYQEDLPNIEDIRATNQSTLGALGDATAKFVGKTVLSTIGNIAGTVYGVADAVAKGDVTKIWDNSFMDAVDSGDKKLDNIFQVYKNSDYEKQNILQRLFLHPTQFTDEATDTASFMAGAVISEILTSGLGSETVVPKALKYMKYLSEGAEATEATKNLTSFATKAITLGGDFGTSVKHLAMGASYEGIVEARQATMQLRDKMYQDYQQQHPDEDIPEGVKNDIDRRLSDAGLFTYLGNLALVGGTNLLLFPKLFGLGHDTAKIATGAIEKDAETGAYKLANDGKHSILDNIGTALTKPIEEANKFGVQGTISQTAKSYWDRKNDPDSKKDVNDFIGEFAKQLADTYSSKEGWNNIGMGMIIGALGAPGRGILSPLGADNPLGKYGYKDVTNESGEVIGKEKLPMWTGGVKGSFDERAEEEHKVGKVLNDLNQNTNFFKAAKANYDTLVENNSLQKEQDTALQNRDIFNFQNAKDDQIHSYVSSRIKNNLFQDLLDEVDKMKQLSPDEFYSNFKGDEASNNATSLEKNKFQQETSQQFLDKANNTRDAIKIADNVYRGDNDDLREELVHSIAASKNLDLREKLMNQSLADLSNGLISNFSLRGTDTTTIKDLLDSNSKVDKTKLAEEDLQKFNDVNTQLKNAPNQNLTPDEHNMMLNLAKTDPTSYTMNKDKIEQLLTDSRKARQLRQNYLDIYNHLFTQEGQTQFTQAQVEAQEAIQKQVASEVKAKQDKVEEDTKKKNIKDTLEKADKLDKESTNPEDTFTSSGEGISMFDKEEDNSASEGTKEAPESTISKETTTNIPEEKEESTEPNIESNKIEAPAHKISEVQLEPEEKAVVKIEKSKSKQAERDKSLEDTGEVKNPTEDHIDNLENNIPINLDLQRTIGNTISYLGVDYDKITKEQENSEGKKFTTEKTYDKYNSDGSLKINKNVDPKLSSPDYYNVNSEVELFVPQFSEMEERRLQNYDEDKFNEDSTKINMFPIAIRGIDGKIVGYLGTEEGIRNNVAPEFVEDAVQDNLNLRRIIFDNKEKTYKVNITSVTPGWLMLDKRSLQRSIFDSMGDKSKLADNVSLSIAKSANPEVELDQRNLFIDKSQTPFKKGEVINAKDLQNGGVYAIVPTKVKDQYLAYPMKVSTIGVDKASTIVEALRLFSLKSSNQIDTKDQQSLENIKEFNFSNFEDLNKFINRITYTDGKNTATANTAFRLFKDNLYLSVGADEGMKFSMEDIGNSKEVRDRITDILKDRYNSVTLENLNNTKTPYISYELDKEGYIVEKQNKNYQSYLNDTKALTSNIRSIPIEGNSRAFTAQSVIGLSNSLNTSTKEEDKIEEPKEEEETKEATPVKDKGRLNKNPIITPDKLKIKPLDDINPEFFNNSNSIYNRLEPQIATLANRDEVAIYANSILGNPILTDSKEFGNPFIRPYKDQVAKFIDGNTNIKLRVFEQLAFLYKNKDSFDRENQYNTLLNILKELHPELSENEIKANANLAYAWSEAKFDYDSDNHEEMLSNAYSGKISRFDFPTFDGTQNQSRLKEYLDKAPFKDIDYNEVDKLNDINPNIDPNRSVMNRLFVDIDKFSDSQQRSVVNSIIYLLEEGKKEGYTSVKDLFQYAREGFQNTKSDIFEPANQDGSLDSHIQKFNDIDNLWDRFEEKAKEYLRGIGVKITKVFDDSEVPLTQVTSNTPDLSTIESTSPDDSFISTEASYQRDNYEDDANFSRSSKDTASAHLKLKLSLIQDVEFNGTDLEPKTNFLSLPEFMNLDKVWTTLGTELTGVDPNDIYPTLQTLSKDNPLFSSVLDNILQDKNTSIQSEFVVAFSKQQSKFLTPKIGKEGVVFNPETKKYSKSGKRSVYVMGTNRQGANDVLIADWYDKFKNSSLVESNTMGEMVVNTNKAKELQTSFDTLLNNKKLNLEDPNTKKALKNGLDSLGITLSPNSIDNLIKNGIKVNNTKWDAKSFLDTYVGLILKRITAGFNVEEEDTESKLELNNPFISETTAMTALARLENYTNPFLYENSFLDGQGKAKYAVVNNSYLSKIFNKIDNSKFTSNMENLLTTSYAKESIWGKAFISEDPTFKENFKLFYLDTLGTDESKVLNKPFSRMSTKEKEYTRISLFQRKGDSGVFLGPIPSDKTTLPLIQALRTKVAVNAAGTFNSETMEALYSPFISEYNRIRDVQAQKIDPKFEKSLILGYHYDFNKDGKRIDGMGDKFLIYDFLNGDKDLFDDKGNLKIVDPDTLKTIVTPKIISFTRSLVKDQLKYWKDLGLEQDKFIDKSYNKKFLKGFSKEEGNIQFAMEYSINQFLAHFNYTQLIGGDPALHGKPKTNKDTGAFKLKESIDSTWINYSKRTAKDIAPGLDGYFSNSNFTTIFLKDLNYTSEQFNKYQEVIGEKAKAYQGLNPADAQEYTTLKEHLAVMKAYGKLTPELEEVGNRLLAGGEETSDIQLILQPMKPVYVGNKVDSSMGINRMYYIKTSAFPLVPSLTKGLEIDKLRIAMENGEIDRAVYESGVKLGLGTTNISTETSQGIVSDNLDLKDKGTLLSRDGFRIQQEVPYHGDGEVNEGSQARKLILVDVEDDDKLNLLGKEFTGKEAKQLYDNIHIEKMNRAYKGLLSDIGARDIGGQVIFKDLSKLQKVLLDEATDRNYNINDIYGLQLEGEKGQERFVIPLGFNNSSARLESIMNSLFTNRIIKSELPGSTNIQGSSAGFNKIRTIDQLNTQVKDSITWIDPKDTELNYIRKSEDGKELLRADILVPWDFTDNKGGELDPRQFIKEDGTLDLERIPESLLTRIGLRIPTQGLNSMMSFRVKGFLPKMVGDLAIVPSEIVAQMGSDFDVDKLFMYRYHYNFNGERFTKINADLDREMSKWSDKQLDNSITQFFEDRYKDPNLLGKIVEPNSTGNLPELSDKISKILGLNKTKNFFTTEAQNLIHKNNADGKSGTAVFTTYSTFIKAAQDAKIGLVSPIVFKSSDRVLRSYTLYGKNIVDSNNPTPSSVVQYYQSASVDNAKDPILGNLNINGQTMDVAATIALSGYGEDYISYFLSQPIIRQYVQELSNSNDITNPTYNVNRELDAQNKVRDSYSLNNEEAERVEQHIEDINPFEKDSIQQRENSFNLEEMEEELKNPSNINQRLMFEQYLAIKNTTKQIRLVQSAISTDTSGLGIRYVDLQIKANNIDITKNNISLLTNTDKLFDETQIGKAAEMVSKALDLYSNILPYKTMDYRYMVDKTLEYMGKADKSELYGDDLSTIYNSAKSYLYTTKSLLGVDNVNIERDRLLYGTQALGNRWEAYIKTPAGKKNLLSERIKVRRSDNTEDPIRLEAINTPAANNSDNNSAMTSFYRMYLKGTDEEKSLAKDLVHYYILTGGRPGANSISKYIPYDILEENGFGAEIKNIDTGLRQGENLLANQIEQYFQHNPAKAISFYPANKDIQNYDIDKGFTLNNGSQYNVVTFDSGTKQYTYPKYMSIYDKDSQAFKLFKIQDTTDILANYSRIDTLGNSYISEYNENVDKQYSSIKSNQSNIEIPDNINTPNLGEVDNTPYETKVAEAPKIDKDYLIDKLQLDNNSIESTLNSIIDNPRGEGFDNIAKDLKELLVNYPDLKISTEGVRDGMAGRYSNNTISINLDNILKNSDSPLQKAQRVVLHEALHAITADKIENYDKLSPEDKKAVDKLRILYNQYKTSMQSDESIKFKKLTEQYKENSNSLSDEDIQFLKDKKQQYYALDSLHEFVAAGLTDDTFVQQLKDNGFWAKVWKAVSNLLGLNESYKNDYDALYSTVLDLGGRDKTESNTTQDDINPSSYDNPKAQKEEFLKKYHKVDGQEISLSSFNTINTSMKANDKYSKIKLDAPYENGKRVLRVYDKSGRQLYDINPEIKMPKSKEEKSIDKIIKNYTDMMSKLKGKRDYKTNISLQARVEHLKNTLENIKKEKSLAIVTSEIKDKLDAIKNLFNRSGNISKTDVEDAKLHLAFYSRLISDDLLKYNESFEEENSNIDRIVRESKALYKVALEKSIPILIDEATHNIPSQVSGVDLNKLLTSPVKEIGAFKSVTLAGHESSNQIIQLMDDTIRDATSKAIGKYQEYEDKIKPLQTEYLKKYSGKGAFDQYLQLDEDGKKTGNLINKWSQTYYNKLQEYAGTKQYSKFVRENTKYYISDENKEDYRTALEDLKEGLPDWNKEGSHDKATYNIWVAKHNPEGYLTRIKKGQRLSSEDWKTFKEYSSSNPADKWLDPKYQHLKSLGEDSIEWRLYKELDSKFRTMSRRYDNQANYVPEVARTVQDDLLRGNFKGSFSRITKELTDAISVKLEAATTNKMLDINGVPIDTIPVYHMSNILKAEEKSDDLIRVLLTAEKQEILLDHKNDMEFTLNTLKELIGNAKVYQTNKQGDILKDEDGVPLEATNIGQTPNLSKQAAFIPRAALYGVSPNQAGISSKPLVTRTTITPDGRTITETRALTATKVVDSISSFTRMKALGFNPASAVGRIGFGVMSTLIYSGDRMSYGEKDAMRSFGVMLQSIIPGSSIKNKVKILSREFQMRMDKTNANKIALSPITQGASDLSMYMMVEKSEDFIQHQTGIAYMMGQKIKDLSGKNRTLWDAFDNNGKWKENEFGVNPYENNSPEKSALISNILNILNAVHGDYTGDNQISENYVYRNLFVMRRWLPQITASRLGEENIDNKGEVRKGRYLSYKTKHLLILPLVRDMYKAFTTDVDPNSIDNRNLRMNAYELSFVPVIWGVALMMKAMLHGLYHDDDKEKAALTFLLNSTTRVSGDLNFFFNPYSFQATIREPIPALKTLMDFMDVGTAVKQEILGNGIYKSGIHKGSDKVITKLVKALPIVNRPQEIYSATSQLFDKN